MCSARPRRWEVRRRAAKSWYPGRQVAEHDAKHDGRQIRRLEPHEALREKTRKVLGSLIARPVHRMRDDKARNDEEDFDAQPPIGAARFERSLIEEIRVTEREVVPHDCEGREASQLLDNRDSTPRRGWAPFIHC